MKPGQILLLGITVIGEAISLYFTFATYHVVPENFIESMPICNIQGERMRIVDTRYARVFYLPNSVYGMVYYLVLFLATIGWWTLWPTPVEFFFFLVSLLVTLFSGYLFWSLFKKLRTPCRLCIISHFLNLSISILLGYRYFVLH